MSKFFQPLIDQCSQEFKAIEGFLDAQPVGSYLPDKSQIFDVFNITTKPRVIIIGMDPYPTPGDADGLAFSSQASKCPASLNRILINMEKNGIIKDKNWKSWSLKHWAMQGVLLLNTALTVQIRNPGSHINIWYPWMLKFIKTLVAAINYPVWVCLWGSNAKIWEVVFQTNTQIKVLTGPHPVAMTTPNFADCNHFKLLPADIFWHPDQCSPTWFYTDGAAKGNQFKNGCRAGWGVWCGRGIYKDRSWGDQLVEERPTNIRAEGWALCFALDRAVKLQSKLPWVETAIYTDSKFWIDMLETYIPGWVANDIDFTKRKNSDIVEHMWFLYKKYRGKIHFINCWHDRTCPTDPTEALHWHGNKYAEGAAEAAIQ